MNRTYILVPVVGMAVFVGYYVYWKTHAPEPRQAVRRIEDEFLGRDGSAEAEADFAAEKLVILETGLYLPWDNERREIARTKYGVELRSMAGCLTTEALARYVDSYNRVMKPKVTARHGREFFDAVNREGLALLEARWAEKRANKAPEPTPRAVTPRAIESKSK